jgi:polar amino acid transport system substrate-binding protein
MTKWIRNWGVRGLAAMALGLALSATAGAQGTDKFQDIISKGVVRIGVPVDAPPFGSVNQQRQPEGFDIELAEMVAKALGVKLEMTQVTGANRIP